MKKLLVLFLIFCFYSSQLTSQNNPKVSFYFQNNEDTAYICQGNIYNYTYYAECKECLFKSFYTIVNYGNNKDYDTFVNYHPSNLRVPVYSSNGIYKVKVKYVLQGNTPVYDSSYINYRINCPFQFIDIFEDINGNCIKDAGEVKPSNFNPNFNFYYAQDSLFTNYGDPSLSNKFYYHPLKNKLFWLHTEDSFWLSSTEQSTCPINYNLDTINFPVIKISNLNSQMDKLNFYPFRDLNQNCIKDVTEFNPILFSLKIYDSTKSISREFTPLQSNFPNTIYVPKNSLKFSLINLGILDTFYNAYESNFTPNCNLNLIKNINQSIPCTKGFSLRINNGDYFQNGYIINDSIHFKSTEEIFGYPDTSYMNVTSSDGHNFNVIPFNNYASIKFTQYGKKVITCNIYINNTLQHTQIDTLYIVDSCLIKGKIYLDSNLNCSYNNSEYKFKSDFDINGMYQFSDIDIGIFDNSNYGTYAITTDSAGNYNLRLPQDTSRKLDIRVNDFSMYGHYYVGNESYSCNNGSILINKKIINLDVGIRNLPEIQNIQIQRDSIIPCNNDTINFKLFYIKKLGTCKINVFWGDGSVDSFYNNIDKFDSYILLKHRFSLIGQTMINVVFKSIDNYTIGAFSDTINILSCGNLSGKVFLDINKNCNYNSNSDYLISKHKLIVKNNSGLVQKIMFTDSIGNYETKIDSSINNYIHIADNILCNSGSKIIAIPSWTSGSQTKDIAINHDSIDYTPFVNFTGIPFPGDTMNFFLGYNGILNHPSTSFTITLPAKTKYVSTTASTHTLTGNKLTINANLPLNSGNSWSQSTMIRLRLDTTLVPNETLCFNFKLHKKLNEDTTNNDMGICLPAMVSYDPNDKNCFSPTANSQGEFLNAKDELKYLIRFQNTGTAPARNIYVLDDIDNHLDPASFKLLSSSHNTEVQINENNTIRFMFKNINLVDSFHDEPNSHGFIMYSIQPKNSIDLNSIIRNTAKIFFDFNDPIITNTTENKFVLAYSTIQLLNNPNQLIYYPNPSDHNLFVKTEQTKSISIFNIQGKLIYNLDKFNNEWTQINTSTIQPGLYLLKLTDKSNHSNTEKLIIQH